MPRLRFSLATLLLTVLLAGSAGALWVRWGPWVVEKRWEKLSVDDQKKAGLFFAVYAPDSERVVVGAQHAAAIYDLRTGAEVTRLQFPPGFIFIGYTARFSPDRRYVHVEPLRRRFDAASGVEDTEFANRFADSKEPNAGETYYSPDFTKRIVHFPSGRVVLFDGPEFGQKHELCKYSSEPKALLTFSFADDSSVLAISDADEERLRLFNLIQYKQIASFQSVHGAVLSPALDKLVIQAGTGLELWNLGGAEPVRQFISSEARSLSGEVHFSPDGRLILAGQIYDDQFIILDASSGATLATFGRGEFPGFWTPGMNFRKTAWRPDGEQIMIGDKTGLTFYRRTRPEWWWGVFCLPELWITAMLSVVLLWKMFKRFRKPRVL